MNTVLCNKCNAEKVRIFRKRTLDGRTRYEDENGVLWSSGRVCPDCRRSRERELRGNRAISGAPPSCVFKGRKSEEMAAATLVYLGFENVTLLGGGGRPDIGFTDSNGVRRFVEVKSAIKNGDGTNCWVTKAVASNRLEDDFVAIVLPSGRVVISTMAHHLSMCSPSGRRGVTALVRRDAELESTKEAA